MPLKVNVTKKEEGSFVISCLGSIDSLTYTELEKKLDALLVSSTRVLILNMEGVDYISSIGVSLVFKTKKAMDEHGGAFILTNLKPQIKAVFEVVKALPTMRVFESIEEADEYLSSIQRKAIEKEKQK